MSHAALPFPVLPGKGEADIRKITERFKSDPAGYRESRRFGGVTLERAYWQHTPMGDFVVAYLETDKPTMGEAIAAAGADNSEMGRFFREHVKEVHGIDLTQIPPGPAPEVVGEWSDPDVTERRKGFAFSAPLLPDAVDRGRAFATEAFVTRRDEHAASRRALGVNREVVTLVHTPMGPVTAVYIEGNDPFEGNRRFAASTGAHDTWFKDQLKTLYPPYI
ncbi:MAG TPA: hypothetical protein VG815_14100, partial [Chloroflexota bacterium]|nr:hypothetical protein [Chloroflexota bacterium]